MRATVSEYEGREGRNMRDISFCDIFIFYKNASLFKRVLLRTIDEGVGRGRNIYIDCKKVHFWSVQVFYVYVISYRWFRRSVLTLEHPVSRRWE